MRKSEAPDAKAPAKVSLPRWLALLLAVILWTVVLPLVHGVLPWAISLLATRHGWTEGRPGLWNWLALILVGVGVACLIWILALHFAQTPERVELEMTPKYLLRRGPYAVTRNPMYLAGLTLWLGWTFFYGSVGILIGWMVLGMCVSLMVRREERALEARFGDIYREYKRTVPRWVGKARR
jgi:protein-S-isoprenylcysteine O-methyltransferase Ste14